MLMNGPAFQLVHHMPYHLDPSPPPLHHQRYSILLYSSSLKNQLLESVSTGALLGSTLVK